MSLNTIEYDFFSGLSLLKDQNDPPRFYVQRRHRRELIAIGDEVLARDRFNAWKARALESGSRLAGKTSIKPAMYAPAMVGQAATPMPMPMPREAAGAVF